jgi:hypothetical protein
MADSLRSFRLVRPGACHATPQRVQQAGTCQRGHPKSRLSPVSEGAQRASAERSMSVVHAVLLPQVEVM